MTIALYQTDIVGPRIYVPEGPYAQNTLYPFPSFKPGTTIEGDSEAEFTFLMFYATAGQTINQGDALCWDNSYFAEITGTNVATGAYQIMTSMGTVFLGGSQIGIQGNNWSYTFAVAGLYGIWAQRAGTSLLRCGTLSAAVLGATMGAGGVGLGTVSFIAGVAHFNAVQGIYNALQSKAFTANTVNGSAVLSLPSSMQFLVRGQTLSGTGIPAGTIIQDFGLGTVIMSALATATGSAVAITASNGSTYVTTTNASKVLTNVTSIAGLYPNQIITGTGIAAGTVIVSMLGNAAPYTINMSLAATATANNINVTVAAPTNAAPNYLEAFLRWPQFSTLTT